MGFINTKINNPNRNDVVAKIKKIFIFEYPKTLRVKRSLLFLILTINQRLERKIINGKILIIILGMKILVNTRVKNFDRIYKFIKQYDQYFDLPTQIPGIKTGWLAYPIIIKQSSKIKRRDMQIFLEKKGIQTRTIFTGIILRQPIMKKKKYKKVKNCSIYSNNIMKNGILIGCHQGLREVEISYMFKNIKLFLRKY